MGRAPAPAVTLSATPCGQNIWWPTIPALILSNGVQYGLSYLLTDGVGSVSLYMPRASRSLVPFVLPLLLLLLLLL